MRYIGWVPTVTGYLSFTVLGNGSFPSRSSRIDGQNGFAVYQRRDLLDVLVPYADDIAVVSFFREMIANWVWGISGQFSFVLLSNGVVEDERCQAEVFIIADAVHRKQVKEIRRTFKNRDATQVDVDSLRQVCSSINCFYVTLVLERGGKASIDSGRNDNDPALDRLLADQVFFFLKDIAHVHQHHDPKHDAITSVSPDPTGSDSDIWIADTQHALYRAIIRYKRFRNEKALFRASGILAYAKSFTRTYKAKSGEKLYHTEELERSLAVSRDEIKHFDQKRLSQIETTRGFFFALFGLAISVSYLARLGGLDRLPVDPNVTVIAGILAQYPFESAAVTFLLSIVYSVFTHKVDPADNDVIRWLTRLVQTWRLRSAILFNVVITGLLCWASYWLLSFRL